MAKELKHFNIDSNYGGNQNRLLDPTMRFGGCGAITACDSCIYFAKYMGQTNLYPFQIETIKSSEYVKFTKIMKPYLRPRMGGIDTLDLYIEGFSQYLLDKGNRAIYMRPFSGENTYSAAKKAIQTQIDCGFLIPYLLLKHKNSQIEDYVWHWFLLNGYEAWKDIFMVKVVTYGTCQWVSLQELWDTGYEKRGGMVLYDINDFNLK